MSNDQHAVLDRLRLGRCLGVGSQRQEGVQAKVQEEAMKSDQAMYDELRRRQEASGVTGGMKLVTAIVVVWFTVICVVTGFFLARLIS